MIVSMSEGWVVERQEFVSDMYLTKEKQGNDITEM